MQIFALQNAVMDFHERLKLARAKHFEQQNEAAQFLGIPIGSYGNWEAGSRRPKPDMVERLANAFRVPLQWLAYGVGGPDEDGLKTEHTVGVVGVISAGGSIETEGEHVGPDGNLFEITVPMSVPEGAFALQVKGDSMWPRYDPDDIVICFRPSDDPLRLVGFEAAVATPEGNRYLKRLLYGSRDGLFNLESHNAPPMRDMQVSWASDIYGVVRAQHWQRLTEPGRKRVIKRATKTVQGQNRS